MSTPKSSLEIRFDLRCVTPTRSHLMPSLIESLTAWKSVLVVASLLLVAVGCGQRTAAPPPAISASPAVPVAIAPAASVVAAPVAARSSPQVSPAPKPLASARPTEPAGETSDWVSIPRVDIDFQRQAASVAEAIRSGAHPERLTPHVAPVPFDRAAVLAASPVVSEQAHFVLTVLAESQP